MVTAVPRPAVDEPLILLAGFDAAHIESCQRLLRGHARVEAIEDHAELLSRVGNQRVAVLCLGPRLSGLPAKRLLEESARISLAPTLYLLTAAGPDPTLFHDLIADDRIFYLSLRPVPVGDLEALLRSALARSRRLAAPDLGTAEEPPARRALVRSALAWARRLAAQRDLASCCELLRDGVRELTDADRAHALLYDPGSETLWSRAPGLGGEERRESAAMGLVSFVARTGRTVAVEHLAGDPRYEREADDPEGSGEERMAAVPVLGKDGDPLAVLAAVRSGKRPPFSAADLEALRLLAERAALPLDQAIEAQRLADAERRYETALRGQALGLFREEALAHRASARAHDGALLQLSPSWLRWTSYLLLAVLAGIVLYVLLGRLDDYADGPAVVQLVSSAEVAAAAPGTVERVAVRPGQHVSSGEILLHLGNVTSGRRADTLVRAPAAGTVREIRVQPGMAVLRGQTLLVLASDRARAQVAVFMPGQYRPLLARGLPLSLELQGYPYSHQRLTIRAVGDRVVGPEEARRYLGLPATDTLPVQGPVVVALADLPSLTFSSEGRSYPIYDGMWGQGEVKVRSQSILQVLVPGIPATFWRRS
jgi:GAF domain-containing protein